MNIYEHYAAKYWEAGYQPVPIEPQTRILKIPKSNEIFYKNLLDENTLEKYVKSHGHWGLGIAMGRVSQIVGVDFDYTGENADQLESMLLGILPQTPCIKVGKKGWTRFYTYHESVPIKRIDRSTDKSRFVDVLSTGSYTVIPPTHHSGEIYYKWVGKDLLDVDREDLPLINLNTVKQIQDIANFEVMGSPLNAVGRHNRIFSFVLSESEKSKDLDQLVEKAFIFDEKINGEDSKGPYFIDKKYFPGLSPHDACHKLVARICEWKTAAQSLKGIQWKIGKSSILYGDGKKASTSYADFSSFFEHTYPETRRDLFTHTGFTYLNEEGEIPEWSPIQNRVDVIESEVFGVGLAPTFVKRHLARWLSQKPYRMLIDIPVWNRKPCVEYMCLQLGVTNIEPEYFIELMKEWMASIFRRIYNCDQQNHFLILRGSQGIGKDFWLDYLVKGFESYAAEIIVQRNAIENYRSVQPLAVARIAEFDETDDMTVGCLKALISSKPINVRAPYAIKSEKMTIRTSFCSSSNFKHLLRDTSGNRRFMIFDTQTVRFGFAEKPQYDAVQLVAEAYHLYQQGYHASQEARDAMNKIIKSETPQDAEQYFVEEVVDIIRRASNLGNKVRWADISDEVAYKARKYNYSVQEVQTIINSQGLRKRDNKTSYYTIPVH